jgi:hypothetical protein
MDACAIFQSPISIRKTGVRALQRGRSKKTHKLTADNGGRNRLHRRALKTIRTRNDLRLTLPRTEKTRARRFGLRVNETSCSIARQRRDHDTPRPSRFAKRIM